MILRYDKLFFFIYWNITNLTHIKRLLTRSDTDRLTIGNMSAIIASRPCPFHYGYPIMSGYLKAVMILAFTFCDDCQTRRKKIHMLSFKSREGVPRMRVKSCLEVRFFVATAS